ALDVKKGEAGAILRALIRKQSLRRGQNTLVVEFQIKLLTLIVSESETESSSLTASNGKNSWLKVLEDLITESDLGLKEFALDWLNKGINGYNDLDISKKLILLNFICDEALGTMKLRSYIDDQNAKIAEEKKAAKSKVAEAKE
ncbi:zinc-finger of monoamine-oxidase A repressor R1, partial [Trifolium medium]|nr:zinc-finger of monoamine-oxidase A repressor R1 [Trifolium medium]